MKKLTFRQVLKSINNYVVFFLTVGFAVSCCMMLFLNVLADSMGLVFDASNIAVAAKLTAARLKSIATASATAKSFFIVKFLQFFAAMAFLPSVCAAFVFSFYTLFPKSE